MVNEQGLLAKKAAEGQLCSSPVPSREELRQEARQPVQFQVFLQQGDFEIAGHMENLGLAGLRLFCIQPLEPGTPMALEFSFGPACYLNVSGQIVYCLPEKDSFALGIKFSGLRPLETKVLFSAIEELKQNAVTQGQSFVRISVTTDSLALEASELAQKAERAILTQLDRLVPVDRRAPVHTADLPSLVGLPTFKLLVDGEEINTYKYKYIPYAEKLITDYKAVTQVLKQFKAGDLPSNYHEYIYGRYCVCGTELNLRAMEAAHRASQEFRSTPISKRLQILTDIYQLLLANKDKLIELMIVEGHPRQLAEWEYLGMEQAYRKESLDFYKEHLVRQIAVKEGEELYWKRNPDGVVCVSPPRNAPCSSSLIAGFALLAGNTLVVKPPLRSPVSTLFLWKEIVNEALKVNSAPAGTLNIVIGNSETFIDEWIESPYVDDILFIGNSKIGLDVGKRAFQSGKKPILELSGNDMMFVWKDAAVDEAVQSLLDGFLGSMQVCMVPKKAFIHADIYEEFERAFLVGVKKLKVGLPSDPEVSLSPVIKIAEFYEFLEDAVMLGAELLCGGIRLDHRGLPDEQGRFISPTVLRINDLNKAKRMKCIREENFFPLMPLVKVSPDSEEHARDVAIFQRMLQIANENEYGLRISAWASSHIYIQGFMDNIHNSGLLRINCRHVGFSPFLGTHGGTRKSGGPYGEMNYVWQKTSHLQGVSIRRKTPGRSTA